MTIKSLILGGAAAVLAATGAQAADLGRPAPAAVDYVKVCDAYGAGFFYIPGGETCLKISGYVRADFKVGDGDFMYNVAGVRSNLNGSYRFSQDGAPGLDAWRSRARALLDIDARTNTEFGLLRSMIEVYWTVDSASSGVGVGVPATSLDLAYIQWGGLTAGRAQSFYDFWTGYAYAFHYGEVASDVKTNLLAYTFAFGNGFTATLAIEDATTSGRRRNGVGNLNEVGIVDLGLDRSGIAYGGNKYPDIVGALALSQAWGSAQLSGALHHLQDISGADEWGWAVQGGVQVNLPMLAPGDKIALQAAYGEGAISYVNSQTFQAGGTGIAFNGIAQSLGNLGADAVFNGGSLRKTEAWAVSAGFTHNFSPAWQFDLQGGYTDVDGFGARDFGQWDVAGDIRWKPAAGFQIGLGLEYRHIDFSGATQAAYSSPGGNIAGRALSDGDAFVAGLRVQRNF